MTSEQSLHERLQRAESWLTAATAIPATQSHETFLFLSIALQCLMSRRRFEGDKQQVQDDLQQFLKKMFAFHSLDQRQGGTILKKATAACRQDGAVLIRDRFLKDAYWRKAQPSPQLQQRLVQESLHALSRVAEGDYRTFLSLALNRIVILRNQIMHGCSTYGAKTHGRSSLARGVKFLTILVPAFHQLALIYGHNAKWEPVPYPRLGSQEHPYRSSR